MILTLPFPPSTNALWRSVKGRAIKSRAYREWEKEAGWAIVNQKPAGLCGPVRLDFLLTRPDKRKRDLDNFLKAPIDLLVRHGVIEDDRKVEAIYATWHDSPKGGVSIGVKPA